MQRNVHLSMFACTMFHVHVHVVASPWLDGELDSHCNAWLSFRFVLGLQVHISHLDLALTPLRLAAVPFDTKKEFAVRFIEILARGPGGNVESIIGNGTIQRTGRALAARRAICDLTSGAIWQQN